MLEAVESYLALISELFGGSKVVQNLLPLDQLTYICAFPGKVFVSAPWLIDSEPIDLREVGYQVGSVYYVLNRLGERLYSETCDGFFQSERCINLIQSAYHGEYFHILFESEKGRQLVLLWVAKEMQPKEQLGLLEVLRQEKQLLAMLPASEIVLETSRLLGKCSQVNVFTSFGSWASPAVEEGELITQVSPNESVVLFPSENQWFWFETELGVRLITELALSSDAAEWKENNQRYHFRRIQQRTITNLFEGEPLLSSQQTTPHFKQIVGDLMLL